MHKRLDGILAPLSTPFVDGEVAYDHLRQNIRRYAGTGLVGLFVLGSNGENPALDEQERLKIFETVMECRSASQTIIAGTSFESTPMAIRFGRMLAEMGADYISVLTPSYYKKALTDDAQVGHFQRIADALPVPIVIYNVPAHTGIALSPKVVETLSRHPNIAAMKDGAPGMFPHYLECAAEGFSLISGTVDSLLPALLIGAVGGVISLANPFPEACCELYRLFKSGSLAEAESLYWRLLKLGRSVSGAHAVAGVKAAMELNGFFGGDPRLPLLPLSKEQKQRLAEVVEHSGILSVGRA
jgi:4-hydroxy-2-oxoglutarate aldolase